MIMIAQLAPVTGEHKLQYWTHKLNNLGAKGNNLCARVTNW